MTERLQITEAILNGSYEPLPHRHSIMQYFVGFLI